MTARRLVPLVRSARSPAAGEPLLHAAVMARRFVPLVLLLICCAAFPYGPWASEASIVMDLPASLSAEKRSELEATRTRLLRWEKELEEKVKSHNDKYSRVPEGSALAIEGRKARAALQTEIDAFKAAVRDFNALVVQEGSRADLDYEVSATIGTVRDDLLADRDRLRAQVAKLETEIEEFHIPLPPIPRHVHEAILLGMFGTKQEADLTALETVSPFSGKPPGAVFFSAGSDSMAAEALRVLLDNLTLGEYTLATPGGKRLVERIRGTHFNRLMAHSNGATVAEALIRKGLIEVEELNIMGGDRSLVNGPGFQDLVASGKVKRVVVWVNPGDLVPIGSSFRALLPLASRDTFPMEAAVGCLAETLADALPGDGATAVEYRVMEGPQFAGQHMYQDGSFFEAHRLKTYLHNIGKFFTGAP